MTKLSAAEFKALKPKKKNKYKAIKTAVDGIIFDSGKEANRYIDLKRLERSGLVTDIVVHPKYWLSINDKPILLRSEGYPHGRRATFKPDFQYLRLSDNKTVVEDVKSKATRTEAYILRKGIFELMYPEYEFREVL